MLFVSAMRNKKNVSQESCLDLCAKPFRMYSCLGKGGYIGKERKGSECKFQRSKEWLDHILKLLKGDGRQ